eukprot:GILJ01009609.1.p1 GENE.GILJ01009609.1~~GILJ01009609.1.p1  ORF type:complete len:362 (+),score=55.69 GILJ01009609.1:147-1088(+)
MSTGANAVLSETAASTICDEWIQEPIYLVNRLNMYNLWHAHEDLTHIFEALAVLNLDINRDIKLLFLEQSSRLPGYADDIWKTVFNGGKELQHMWNFIQSYKERGVKHVCIKRSVWAATAVSNILHRGTNVESKCRNSAVVRAMSDYILQGFDLRNMKQDGQETIVKNNNNNRVMNITFISRKPYVNRETVGRGLENEDSVIERLQRIKDVFVLKVDFANLDLREQIEIVRKTDLLIGVHGAGLMHTLYLKPSAGVIELIHPTRSNAYHYVNLAAWCNLIYEGVAMNQHTVNENNVMRAADRIITQIRRRGRT